MWTKIKQKKQKTNETEKQNEKRIKLKTTKNEPFVNDIITIFNNCFWHHADV